METILGLEKVLMTELVAPVAKFIGLIFKHFFLIFLLLLILLTRAPYITDGAIPFGFDHGKDSLAILHMLETGVLSKIGPWTSIPGLYFGPAWYYLLAPFYFFSGLNPTGAVWAMVLLVMIETILAYKYFGKVMAVIVASAPFWLIASTSAWNPFPMALITLILLIIFAQIRQEAALSPIKAGLIGLVAGLGFHFSAAYAIFYISAVVILLFYLKPKAKLRNYAMILLGFVVAFLPQINYEFENNFIELKAIIAYFAEGESQKFTAAKVADVIKKFSGESRLFFLPDYRLLPEIYNKIIQKIVLLGLVSVIFFNRKKFKQKSLDYYLVLCVAFIVIPLFGFFFLHFNVWYLYAIAPVMALLIAKVVGRSPKTFQIIFCGLMIVSPITTLTNYYQHERSNLLENSAFLEVKREVIERIREEAGGRPFSVYHYVPDIYDFPYQYLYLAEALNGEKLPVEFSYMPKAVPYIPEKNALLNKITMRANKPAVIFYVVENAVVSEGVGVKRGGGEEEGDNEVGQRVENELLNRWWGDQKFGEITKTIVLNNLITIYVATPPKL